MDASRIIAQHEALIRRLARALPGDFDDLCQAGRIGVWQCIQTYGKELPASLASVCARREMIDEVRREMRHQRLLKVNHCQDVFVSPDCTPDEAAKAMAYRRMDVEERFLIERRLEGYQLPELGAMIGRCGSRACQIIYKAIRRLQCPQHAGQEVRSRHVMLGGGRYNQEFVRNCPLKDWLKRYERYEKHAALSAVGRRTIASNRRKRRRGDA